MSYWVILYLLGIFLPLTVSHGRLVKPPGRSTAWRYGFNTPTNYNDHELFCGGFSKQWISNKGKCGPCGDAWDQPRPRSNEHGGHYGKGVIVAEYKDGDVIEITVQLTANHKGFFEFRLCPHNSLKNSIPETVSCFEKYLLYSTDGQDRHVVLSNIYKFNLSYRLPDGLTCSQCVLQWRYVAGNNWNKCGNGTGRIGCGPQEEFRACADIRIIDDTGHYDNSAQDTGHHAGTLQPVIPTSIPTISKDEDHSDESLEDSIASLEPITHSKTGQIIAIVVAILISLLLLVVLLLLFLWERKHFAVKKLKLKSSWWPVFLPCNCSDPLEKIPPIVLPIPPPRMRRPHTTYTTHAKLPVINIGMPTAVTVNGLPVPTIKSKLKIVPKP